MGRTLRDKTVRNIFFGGEDFVRNAILEDI